MLTYNDLQFAIYRNKSVRAQGTPFTPQLYLLNVFAKMKVASSLYEFGWEKWFVPGALSALEYNAACLPHKFTLKECASVHAEREGTGRFCTYHKGSEGWYWIGIWMLEVCWISSKLNELRCFVSAVFGYKINPMQHNKNTYLSLVMG